MNIIEWFVNKFLTKIIIVDTKCKKIEGKQYNNLAEALDYAKDNPSSIIRRAKIIFYIITFAVVITFILWKCLGLI